MMETRIFRALADPTRRAVYERLAQSEMRVSDLKAGFDVSQPAVSQHLATLREAGLVLERKEGRNVFYRARPDGLAPLVDWLARYRAFWPERLAKLGELLKDMGE